MTDYDQLVAAYEVDVRFPDVSGMEHPEMLRTRSDIARGATHLTAEQRARLAEAQLPDLSPQETSGLVAPA